MYTIYGFTGFMEALGQWSNAKHRKLIGLGRKSCDVVLCSVYAGSLIKKMSDLLKIKKTKYIKCNKKLSRFLKHPMDMLPDLLDLQLGAAIRATY